MVRWAFIVALLVFVVGLRTASAQPAPFTVDADTITYDSVQQIVTAQGNVRLSLPRHRVFADQAQYDLRTEMLTASGRVRLVDTRGQELRGQRLTFNTRTEEGFLIPVEGTLERRVHVRGDRLDAFRDRYVARDSTVTTCDPERPLYRIVARQIEIRLGDQVIARDATLYLGGRKLVTLRQYVIPLRPGEEGTRVPGAGVSKADGFWVDYKLPVPLEGGVGRLALKVGTISGPMALLSLTRHHEPLDVTLRLGRTQTSDTRQQFDLLRYDVAEILLATTPARIGKTPWTWKATALAGWYSEQLSRVQTAKFDGTITAQASGVLLPPRLFYNVNVGLETSRYTVGATRTVTSYGASLAYRLDPYTYVALGYSRVIIDGSTPLSIDVIDPADTVSLALGRTVPFRYTWSVGVDYNRTVPETKLNGTLFVIVSSRLELGVQAIYNTRLTAFEDVDYTVRVVCDCIDVVFRYRQVRGEWALEVGLMDFPPRPAPFVPRPVPPPPALPEQ